MSIFYDLKRSLLEKFLELVPAAKPNEVVFTAPAPAESLVGKESVVTLTAGEHSRTFALDRTDLATLFSGVDPLLKPLLVTSEAVHLRDSGG